MASLGSHRRHTWKQPLNAARRRVDGPSGNAPSFYAEDPALHRPAKSVATVDEPAGRQRQGTRGSRHLARLGAEDRRRSAFASRGSGYPSCGQGCFRGQRCSGAQADSCRIPLLHLPACGEVPGRCDCLVLSDRLFELHRVPADPTTDTRRADLGPTARSTVHSTARSEPSSSSPPQPTPAKVAAKATPICQGAQCPSDSECHRPYLGGFSSL